MSARKERLTVTVDPEFIEAGNDAVAEGKAESLSAWVNAALAERVARERRLVALTQAVTTYEERFGVISAQELAEQARADRESAVVLRGNRAGGTKSKARRRATK
jgi:uncharacterized protein YllA (UPF0747 family)